MLTDRPRKLSRQTQERRVRALELLALGARQVDAAREVGVSVRTVRRWQEAHRLGVPLVPPGDLHDRLQEAFEAERHSLARAQILTAMASLAVEEARLVREVVRRHGVPTWPLPPTKTGPDPIQRAAGAERTPDDLRRAATWAFGVLDEAATEIEGHNPRTGDDLG